MAKHARQRQRLRQVGQHVGGRIQGQGRAALAQHQQAGHVVDLGIHQQHGRNTGIAHGAGGLQGGCGADLHQDVG